MAIADTIQSMYTHVGDVYDTITNVDLPTNKNIQNIPSTMRSSYLEIMNNGIDKIWNNWEKVTGEGETLTLNSTEEAPMKINLKGNTSQETTTGSQLIDFTTFSNSNTTNSFINDILTINTSSGTYANAFKNITSIYKSNPSKVLRFDFTSLNSTMDLSGANGYVRLRIVKTDNSVTNVNLVNTDKSISTHTIPNDVSDISSVSLTIYANNTNTAMTNTLTINKPILHFGSTSTDYEPYTNGASPNPDYPQDIHVVSGNNSIIVSNSDNTQSQSYPITLPEGMFLGWIPNTDYRDIIFQAKTGDTYYDSLDSTTKESLTYGKWYLNKQIGKVVFDGSESWSINTSYTYNVFYRTLDNYARISNVQTTYCEYYKGIENAAGIADFGNNYNNSIGVRTANDNIKDIYISNNSITSASDFKTWLSTHNTTVYYVLANPTHTEITDSTLISQLEALNGAKSYTNQTNINQDNNDKPFILDATALKQLTQEEI